MPQAAEDDIIPLSMPIQTARGESVDAVFVRKGTIVTFPIECINRSVAFWGPDAKEFNPSRWLDDSVDQHRAQEIQGYRHLLTFSDGARMCLGKVGVRVNSELALTTSGGISGICGYGIQSRALCPRAQLHV
jgi:cytochrome P450